MAELSFELRELRDRLYDGGGAERIARQHAQGKLTARERVDLLLDDGEPWFEIGLLVAGIAALTLGADQAVRGAVSIAANIGISETAIGATIVATGTSLPEVATSVTAALRKQHEIAVANIVGSNIFNLLGVLGLTSGIVSLEVAPQLYQFEIPALVVSTLILLPLAWPRARIGRPEGALLVVLYVVFVWVVLARA